jgi:hypothetical protein
MHWSPDQGYSLPDEPRSGGAIEAGLVAPPGWAYTSERQTGGPGWTAADQPRANRRRPSDSQTMRVRISAVCPSESTIGWFSRALISADCGVPFLSMVCFPVGYYQRAPRIVIYQPTRSQAGVRYLLPSRSLLPHSTLRAVPDRLPKTAPLTILGFPLYADFSDVR